MNWKSSRSAAQNASVLLPKMVEKYFKAGRNAVDGDRSAKELHGFRLKTKRLRYTLELFRPLYGRALEQQLVTLHELQGVLGKLSDYATMRKLLKRDKLLERRLELAEKRKLREFHNLWAVFDAEGQLDRWKSALARSIDR